jgi:hypothetical protein
MTDALQNPHPKVPFASVGDDTMAALTDLAAIFKLKLRQSPSPATQAAPAKVGQLQSLTPTSNQISNSPTPISRQKRSQMTINTQDIVKLLPLPLPHPPVRARTDARTNSSAQRATQLRSVLARVYAVSIQNQITTTVPLL